MDLPERWLVGGFAIFMTGAIVQAFRTGILNHEDGAVDINENPLGFAVLVGLSIIIVAMLAWIAAGSEMVELWGWIAPVAMWRP